MESELDIMDVDMDVDMDEDINKDSDSDFEIEDDEDGIFRECNAIAEDMATKILESEIPLSTAIVLFHQYPPKSLKQEVCIKWCMMKLIEIDRGSPRAPTIKGQPIYPK